MKIYFYSLTERTNYIENILREENYLAAVREGIEPSIRY